MNTVTPVSSSLLPFDPPGPLREFWLSFTANRGAFVALIVFALIAVASLFAPLIAQHDPIEQYRDFMLVPPAWMDGGGTRFVYQDATIEARRGRTLIWPPDFTHTHVGVVSERDHKYIITGWMNYFAPGA